MPNVIKKFLQLKYAKFVVALFQFLNLSFDVGFMMGIRNNWNCISGGGEEYGVKLRCLFHLDSSTYFEAGGFFKDNST